MLNTPEIGIEVGTGETITSLHFSPDSLMLASGHSDQKVRIWEVTPFRQIQQLSTADVAYPVNFGSNGSLLAAGSGETFYVWQVPDFTLLFNSETSTFWPMRLNPHEPLIAIGGENGVCDLWDVASKAYAGSLTGHSDQVIGLDFSPDGTLLASGEADGTVRVWQVATKSEVCVLEANTGKVTAVAFSPDGEVLAVGGQQGIISLWDIKARTILWHRYVHNDGIFNLAFEPSGDFFASASLDKTARVWQRKSGTVINMIEYPDELFAVAFSGDGAWLAVGGTGPLQIWRWGYPKLVVKYGRFSSAVAKASIERRIAGSGL